MGIKDEMPVLARHEGEWEGTYTTMDPEGKVIDHYRSHLTCASPSEGDYPYVQTNRYTWPDGRHEQFSFPASYHDKSIWFDTERLRGRAWEIDENTIILHWTYLHAPGSYLYEMIQISPDNNLRFRVWQWFEQGQLIKRTFINEARVV